MSKEELESLDSDQIQDEDVDLDEEETPENNEEEGQEGYSKREKGLYARLKKSEAEIKELKKQLDPAEEKPEVEKPTASQSVDPDELSKKVRSDLLKDQNDQYLEEAEYSDDFKAKVREELERSPNKSAEAIIKSSEYLQFHLGKENDNTKAAQAANNGAVQGGTIQEEGSMPDKFRDPAYMITEEGRKEFDEWSKNQ